MKAKLEILGQTLLYEDAQTAITLVELLTKKCSLVQLKWLYGLKDFVPGGDYQPNYTEPITEYNITVSDKEENYLTADEANVLEESAKTAKAQAADNAAHKAATDRLFSTDEDQIPF